MRRQMARKDCFVPLLALYLSHERSRRRRSMIGRIGVVLAACLVPLTTDCGGSEAGSPDVGGDDRNNLLEIAADETEALTADTAYELCETASGGELLEWSLYFVTASQ